MSCTEARFSFELYPPRTERAAAALPGTIDLLAATRPDFISVTYGAGGSSRTASLDVLRYIIEHTDVSPMAHLTCVGSSHEEAHRLIRDFLDAGVRRFLAVRGDPPEGLAEGDDGIGDIRTTAELVQLIHRVQAERVPYGELAVPELHAQAVLEHREHVQIAVAAFPNGHPSSHSVSQDIDALLAKQAAGANLGITQLFFHAEDYFHFTQRAAEAGVTFPILPGIMPVTSPARLKRMLELSGEDLPSDLAIELEVEPTDEGRREIGIAWAARLGERLLAGGAPGLHLYTFNQHEAVLSVLDRIGALPAASETASTTPANPATEKEPA
ncbi:methylenetetrahydrofolate reductase (NADPH) [Leifsonia sp. 98AMF]|jgi:methylenetetrahydrofolate reductase (NADPH)|uniref:methylenetetrahydrofolate reductase n=1 Tax=unclassified Leifsonia TaxID=2663824 RepID=UPI00087B4DCF|nr:MULTISPECIES: methylenetetrahydrofolate reductase [unclassified Leifsonia]SDH44721.1 methylenetetrahydrofolate reductase (NADPH) [Leifsonia sp. 197AMF]SDI92546.1 methylenetetrahydrofolate reductase (NADPH) [Leifsonia sp. 466MF]SDJ86411.1 methylenetetrahydrofolate reductase (NADPH) [Leifsonia sp. 157MF]SDN96261.1 methylenetetrahydrofolate reductase (NADPH) [Leifsonia sp. 509MF]SEN09099.1 methylenetetrahydrofolate reductase (NADPH) [Leifsonia sp. 467MF]